MTKLYFLLQKRKLEQHREEGGPGGRMDIWSLALQPLSPLPDKHNGTVRNRLKESLRRDKEETADSLCVFLAVALTWRSILGEGRWCYVLQGRHVLQGVGVHIALMLRGSLVIWAGVRAGG